MSDIIVRVTPPSTEVTKVIVSEGVEGPSAYEVAVENGFVGTEAEWLLTLNSGAFYANLAAFPATGTDGVIYLAKDTDTIYRWDGAAYVEVGGGGGGGAVDSVNGQTGVVVLDTGDISEVTDKRYVTDAHLVVIGNTSGTNSGNETATTIGALIGGAGDATPNDTDNIATALTASGILKKITWTNAKAFLKTYFDTLYPSGSGNSSGTNTGDNATNTTSNTYADGKVADAINDGTTTIAPSQNAVFDALALKSPLASPTFTGTVTTPSVIVSSETASRVAIIDGSKNVKSADTATYPSLTELALIKGNLNGVEAAYGGTITWTAGAAPSGASSLRQFYTKVGNLVTYQISLTYATTGTTVTVTLLTFPTEFPTPAIPSGFTGASVYIFPGIGRVITTPSGTVSATQAVWIQRNSGDNGFNIFSQFASGSYRTFHISGSYFTA